jgi:cob(I)alamin adenosyltransferase
MENKETKLYTKSGDKGLTTLLPGSQVSKADERVEAMGSVEEIVASLGLVRSVTTCPIFRGKLERIMKTLSTLRAGLADPRGGKYVFSAEEITFLEVDMDKMLSKLGDAELDTALPGGCEQSSRLDMHSVHAATKPSAMIRPSAQESGQ